LYHNGTIRNPPAFSDPLPKTRRGRVFSKHKAEERARLLAASGPARRELAIEPTEALRTE
jgi:hypothetical protein